MKTTSKMKMTNKNQDDLKNEDNLRSEDDLWQLIRRKNQNKCWIHTQFKPSPSLGQHYYSPFNTHPELIIYYSLDDMDMEMAFNV